MNAPALLSEGEIEAALAALPPALREGRPAPRLIRAEDYDRRLFIGSSNIAALMGHAPEYSDGDGRQTPYDVYLAKTSENPEQMAPAKKKWLERRKRWEPVVVQTLREELNAEIIGTNQQYIDPDLPFVASEIDAEFVDDDGSIANIEIKTVNTRAFSEKFGWGEAGTNQCPIHYYLQCQWGLMVTGRKRTILAALPSYDDVIFYPIERDETDILAMREVAFRFWHRNVLAKIAPDPQTIPDLRKIYPSANPGLRVDGTTEVGIKALRYRAIKAHISALELEAESCEFEVKAFMKDAEALFVDGRKLITFADQNWSDLDEALLKEKFPDAHKACQKGPRTINPLTGKPYGKRRIFKPLAGW